MTGGDVGGRLLKLGGAVACLGGAWLCAFAAGMGGKPAMLAPAAGCLVGSVVLAKQAVFGYSSDEESE